MTQGQLAERSAALGVAAEAFADCEEGMVEGAGQLDKCPRGRPRKAAGVAQEAGSDQRQASGPSKEKKSAKDKRRKA